MERRKIGKVILSHTCTIECTFRNSSSKVWGEISIPLVIMYTSKNFSKISSNIVKYPNVTLSPTEATTVHHKEVASTGYHVKLVSVSGMVEGVFHGHLCNIYKCTT